MLSSASDGDLAEPGSEPFDPGRCWLEGGRLADFYVMALTGR